VPADCVPVAGLPWTFEQGPASLDGSVFEEFSCYFRSWLHFTSLANLIWDLQVSLSSSNWKSADCVPVAGLPWTFEQGPASLDGSVFEGIQTQEDQGDGNAIGRHSVNIVSSPVIFALGSISPR
jgi:hypothetical protein